MPGNARDSVPPKYAAAQVLGFMKGKSAIHFARTFMGWEQNFTGHHFWARGYFVSTVGKDEETIKEYIKKQEEEDRRLYQLRIFRWLKIFNRFERFTIS